MRVIAVTGPDGSGKSTTCKKVVKALESQWGSGAIVQVSVWDALMQSDLFPSKAKVVEYLNDLDGFTRTLFIYHALSRSIDLAKRKNPQLILVEGYWYKYAITEMGQGVDNSVVVSAAQGFPKPDCTICLDVDPQTAWSRKQDVSLYEQGVQTNGAKRDRFIQFQTHLASIWKNFENQWGPWIHISSHLSPDEVAQSIVSILIGKRRENGT